MDRDEALKLLRGGPEGIRKWNKLNSRSTRDTLVDGQYVDDPSLRDADLRGITMAYIKFQDVDLEGADLRGVNLFQTDFRNANLRSTNLAHASLVETDFRGANLQDAFLEGADLTRTKFEGANLSGAIFAGTVIVCDFSRAAGLSEVHHRWPSHVSIDSILSFKGELPEKFLKGCGIRDEEIAYFRSVVGKPIQFYSCFISYSSGDEDFATQLHNDLQAAGIRCWKWNYDARTGRSLWGEIDQAIRFHDKLVLIASESSLKSPAVNREIERAIRQEDERGTDVLFPVRVDDFILHGWEHERKVDVTRKVIADARNWTDPRIYKAVLDKLIRDLKTEA